MKIALETTLCEYHKLCGKDNIEKQRFNVLAIGMALMFCIVLIWLHVYINILLKNINENIDSIHKHLYKNQVKTIKDKKIKK